MAQYIHNLVRADWKSLKPGDIVYGKAAWQWKGTSVFCRRWVVDPQKQLVSSKRDLSKPGRCSTWVYRYETVGVHFHSSLDILSPDFNPNQ